MSRHNRYSPRPQFTAERLCEQYGLRQARHMAANYADTDDPDDEAYWKQVLTHLGRDDDVDS